MISIYKSNWQQKAKIPTSIAISSYSLTNTHTNTHTLSLYLSLSLCHAQSLTLFPKCGLKMCTLSFWCLLCSTIYSLSKNVPPFITDSCWNERLNYQKNNLIVMILLLYRTVHDFQIFRYKITYKNINLIFILKIQKNLFLNKDTF